MQKVFSIFILDFMNKIEANDLIWVRPLAIMGKGHNFNNFTKIGWSNEREGIREKLQLTG